MNNAVKLPLFPLNVVLFPGGVLPLRIFEPRYLNMVSECLKQGTGFAVMAIKSGSDTDYSASFHTLGTVAEIVDFDRLNDGMLGITCLGGGRVLLHDRHTRNDHLIIGEMQPLEPEDDARVDVSHRPLTSFLGSILEREEIKPYRRWLREDWHSASWLGFRLAELLPLPPEVKQHLLEMRDARERLNILGTILRDNRLV